MICSQKEGRKEARKCQGVGLVIILYEPGLARLNQIGEALPDIL
jgi:hypothetical protein